MNYKREFVVVKKMDRVKNLGKKFLICLVLSFSLFLIVYFSEIFVAMIHDIKSNPYTLPNILYFFLIVFGIVPFSLWILWIINPFLIEKILETFGLGEEEKESKETKVEEENEKKKSMSTHEKLVVILGVVSLLATICNI